MVVCPFGIDDAHGKDGNDVYHVGFGESVFDAVCDGDVVAHLLRILEALPKLEPIVGCGDSIVLAQSDCLSLPLQYVCGHRKPLRRIHANPLDVTFGGLFVIVATVDFDSHPNVLRDDVSNPTPLVAAHRVPFFFQKRFVRKSDPHVVARAHSHGDPLAPPSSQPCVGIANGSPHRHFDCHGCPPPCG